MKFKRLIAIYAAICVFFTVPTVFAQDEYMSRGEVADYLLCAADDYNKGLVRSDIIKGYDDGNLYEERLVTRAEALVMLSRAFGTLPECIGHNARVSLKSEDFKDIPVWAQKELKDVFDSGIAGGTGNGLFSPDTYVTKGQMELFAERVFALFATNPKDDFYAAVNKDLLETLELSGGNVIAGPVYDIQNTVGKRIEAIITDALKSNSGKDTPKQKIADFYKSITDTQKRDKEKIKPIEKYLAQIESAATISELVAVENTLREELCVGAFVNFALTVDMKDSSSYILLFETMKPLMNKEVYTKSGTLQESYKEYIKTLLTLSGESKEDAERNAQEFFELEKILAQNMLGEADAKNTDVSYNVLTYNKLVSMFVDFDMEKVLKGYHFQKADKVLVEDENLLRCFSELFTRTNFNAFKTALKIAVLNMWGETLSNEFSQARYLLDVKLTGKGEMYTPEQQAVLVLQEEMPDYIGTMYAEKYFDKNTIKYIEDMAKDIIKVFKSRIEKLSWMNKEAKEKAIKKLDTMKIKVGCADVGASYLDNVEILSPKKGGTFFSNLLNIKKERRKSISLLQNTQPRRDLWDICPYTVNACYNPLNNDITVPAAMLEKPLYDKNNGYEENLGGIGWVIAHEICHAFDNNGAHFDEYGNMGNWWSDEDYAAFDMLCNNLRDFYDGEEAIAGVPTDGKLTLGENAADLGGAVCITQLAKEKGDVDFKLLYTSMARALACTKTREFALYQSKTDTHADEKLRINRVLMNIDEFYDAFNITQGDAMYVAPEDRINMW
ncbi:MAG: S-layer homology domain-containing protein [Clostridia bacterium]|nr:S-layer homology domain-containing protein [Clostridia bacterium]